MWARMSDEVMETDQKPRGKSSTDFPKLQVLARSEEVMTFGWEKGRMPTQNKCAHRGMGMQAVPRHLSASDHKSEGEGGWSRQVGQGQEISFPFISRFLDYIPISWCGTDPETGLRWDQSSYTGNCMGLDLCYRHPEWIDVTAENIPMCPEAPRDGKTGHCVAGLRTILPL